MIYNLLRKRDFQGTCLLNETVDVSTFFQTGEAGVQNKSFDIQFVSNGISFSRLIFRRDAH